MFLIRFKMLVKRYDLGIDDNFEAVRMENSADCRVEFVELVNEFATVDVPEHAVIQNEIVGRVECRSIARIVVGLVGVVEGRNSAARRDVVYL